MIAPMSYARLWMLERVMEDAVTDAATLPDSRARDFLDLAAKDLAHALALITTATGMLRRQEADAARSKEIP